MGLLCHSACGYCWRIPVLSSHDGPSITQPGKQPRKTDEKITIFNGKTHYKWPFLMGKLTGKLT